MKLPPLTIGKFTAPVPLVQGGMSIRVSTSALAIPVAECGGIGTIGGSAIPLEELQADIRKAKAATRGIIAVNIMFAMKNFYSLVQGSIEAGVDMIVTGAGFSRDIFKIGKETNTPIVSIVSSPSFAMLAEKLGAAAIVVEAKEAGGHLGTNVALRELFPEIRKVVKKVPLIAAGGITNGYEMAEMENKLAKIEDANKNLEIEISSLRQVERIQAAAEKLGMVTTEKTEYLVGKKESLARK